MQRACAPFRLSVVQRESLRPRLLCPTGITLPNVDVAVVKGQVPAFRVGTLFGSSPGTAFSRVEQAVWLPSEGVMRRCLLLEPLAEWPEDANTDLFSWSSGYSIAWVTLSDKGWSGERKDRSGPRIEELFRDTGWTGFIRGYLLADEEDALAALLADLAFAQGYDCIVTTGGTGLSPRDRTPEATLRVITQRLPGLERAMTTAALAATPHGALSRAVAGVAGSSMVINVPGSVRAVEEMLAAVLPALRHGLDKLQGDPTECGG